MSQPQFMQVWEKPGPVFIKSGLLAWSAKCLPWDGTELPLFLAHLNDTLGTHITVTEAVEILEHIADMGAIDAGTFPFDTHCKDPERAVEESDARDTIDDLVNEKIVGLS